MKWAMDDAPCPTSSTFATLVVFANFANEYGRCYPSTETVATKSRQNAKTVRAAIDRLEADGLLVDTGARVGRTGNIKVYALGMEGLPEVGALKGERALPVAEAAPEGAGEPARAMHPETAVLRSVAKAPVSGPKGTRKRVGEPVREPITPENASAFSAPGGRKNRAAPLRSDWEAPAIDDLPEPARTVARQWPTGAYASQGAGHRAHMIGSGRKAVDHDALWAARVVQLGASPIRDGKVGLRMAEPRVDEGVPVDVAATIARYERMGMTDQADAMRRRAAGG